MDYFIVFGTIGILFLVSITIIFRLMYQMSDMKYELKLGKINCQKDLDRLEDSRNRLEENIDEENYVFDQSYIEELINNIQKKQ